MSNSMANSEAKLSSFKYDALPTPTSIRLLRLLPPRESRISCELVVGNLEDNLRFQALSYTWGTPNTIWEEQVDEVAEKEKVTSNREGPGASKQDEDQATDEADAFRIFGTSGIRPYERVDHEAAKNHPIECNGCVIWITENLLQALSILLDIRTHDDNTLNWVDAICINQDDLQERAAQVALMGLIFQSAENVVGWLGPSEGHDEFGGSLLGRIFEEIIDPTTSKIRLGLGHLESLEEVDITQHLGLFSFLQRLWFRRVWIVQELVFARKLMLIYGRKNILPWEVLEIVLEYLAKHNLHRHIIKNSLHLLKGDSFYEMYRKLSWCGLRVLKRTPKPRQAWVGLEIDPMVSYDFVLGIKELRMQLGLPSLQYTLTERNWSRVHLDGIKILSFGLGSYTVPSIISQTTVHRQPKRHISLEILLTMFRSCMATDPRDKIFALQNIALQLQDANQVRTLKADYTIKAEDVYYHVTKSIIEHSNNLSILSQVQDPSYTQFRSLPSWVPDFSVGTRRKILGRSDQIFFSVSGKRKSTRGPIIVNENTLEAKGVLLDRISEVAESKGCYFVRTAKLTLHLPKWYSEGHTRLSNFVSPFAKPDSTPIAIPIYSIHTADGKRPKRSVTRVEAYWRTLLADYLGNQHPAPIDFGFAFADWILFKLKAAEHYIDLARKFKNANYASHPHLYKGLLTKRIILKYLADGENGGTYTLTEIEAVKDQLKFAVGEEIGSQVDIDLSCGIRFLPGLLDPFVSNTKDAKDNSPRYSVGVGRDSNSPEATFPKESFETSRQRLDSFMTRLSEVKEGTCMFRTANNRLGIGPVSTKEGDEVWILDTAAVPFILRRRDDGSRQVIGECYVHGIMHGEVLEEGDALFETVIFS